MSDNMGIKLIIQGSGVQSVRQTGAGVKSFRTSSDQLTEVHGYTLVILSSFTRILKANLIKGI